MAVCHPTQALMGADESPSHTRKFFHVNEFVGELVFYPLRQNFFSFSRGAENIRAQQSLGEQDLPFHRSKQRAFLAVLWWQQAPCTPKWGCGSALTGVMWGSRLLEGRGGSLLSLVASQLPARLLAWRQGQTKTLKKSNTCPHRGIRSSPHLVIRKYPVGQPAQFSVCQGVWERG